MLKAIEAGAPHPFQQLGAAEHAARVVGQEVEQVKFAQGQRHFLASQADAAVRQVDPQAAHLHHLRYLCWGLGFELLHPAQQCAHAGGQLQHRKGLGQVVVGAQFQAQHPFGLCRAGAEDDDGHMAFTLAQVAADLKTVGAGQHQVEQHQVPAFGVDAAQRCMAVGGVFNLVARTAQVQGHHVGHRRIVFHQQHA